MLEKLGSGAFGDVNKGLYNPEENGIPEFAVAIKVLKDQPTREEREELMKEATVSAQFTHDNIVMCVGVVTAGTPVMLVLQLCDKGSLHGLLKKAEPPVSIDSKGKYVVPQTQSCGVLSSEPFGLT
jgi:serine/threonine protein kinase